MWNLFGYAIACTILGGLVPSTTAAGLFDSLLGDQNNNNPNIPLLGTLGLGPNANEQNRPNNNFNQYTNNNNNQFSNNNANRGLLSALGVNNVNRPNINNLNNLNRYPNSGQNNPSKNINDLKHQLEEANKKLERIKELNKLKEQQKLDNEKANNQGQVNPVHDNESPDINSNKINNNGDRENVLWKSLTKKKFYFIVKPVVPENETKKYNQTVFYIE